MKAKKLEKLTLLDKVRTTEGCFATGLVVISYKDAEHSALVRVRSDDGEDVVRVFLNVKDQESFFNDFLLSHRKKDGIYENTNPMLEHLSEYFLQQRLRKPDIRV